MKLLAPILVLIGLTAPGGQHIWVEKSHITMFLGSVDCAQGAHAKLVTLSGIICVQETPETVAKRMEGDDAGVGGLRGLPSH